MNNGYYNLENILNISTDDERHRGCQWYQQTSEFSETLASRYQINKEIVVGIIAALSPRCPWRENIIQAKSFIQTKGKVKTTTYKSNKKKALAILRGKNPQDVLNGHKVRAFYFNILSPENSTEVCIDTHIISAWFNRCNLDKAFLNTVFHPRGSRRNIIQEIKQAVIQLASKYHLKPLQVQAILWLTWKRITENKPYSSHVEYRAVLEEVTWNN